MGAMREPSDPIPPSPQVDPVAAPPPPSVFDIQIRLLPISAPLRWLRLGWRDFMRCPSIGLFYGACFVAMGWALLYVFRHAPAYTLALSAGFLLVGPLLCLGLYDASLRLERGETPDLGRSLLAWEPKLGTLAIFGGVLLVLEMIWGRASLIIFAVSFDGMPDFQGSLLKLLDPENVGFIITYLVVGAFFAGLIFAISVVSIPMILHRQADAITAGLVSFRLCLAEPAVMFFWAALIAAVIGLGMLPALLGLLVAAPVVGHATWHAYRESVVFDASDAGRAEGATKSFAPRVLKDEDEY